MTTLLLLGEALGSHVGHDPDRHALYPYPPNCAGARLRTLMGMGRAEYVRLDRMNLVPEYPGKTTPMSLARAWAARRLEAGMFRRRSLLVVGAVPQRALGIPPGPYFHWRRDEKRGFEYALVPHTSGLCRVWNDLAVAREGRIFLGWTAERARQGERSFSASWLARPTTDQDQVQQEGGHPQEGAAGPGRTVGGQTPGST